MSYPSDFLSEFKRVITASYEDDPLADLQWATYIKNNVKLLSTGCLTWMVTPSEEHYSANWSDDVLAAAQSELVDRILLEDVK